MAYCINCYCSTCIEGKKVDNYFISSGDQFKIKTVFPINTIELKNERDIIINKSSYTYLYYDSSTGFHHFVFLGNEPSRFIKKTQDNITEIVVLPKESN